MTSTLRSQRVPIFFRNHINNIAELFVAAPNSSATLGIEEVSQWQRKNNSRRTDKTPKKAQAREHQKDALPSV